MIYQYVFPEFNWKIKFDDNRNMLNNWRKNIVKYDLNDCDRKYTHLTFKGSGLNNKTNAFDSFITITTDEFVKYVLKENRNPINEPEDLGYLKDLLNKLTIK